MVPRDMPSRTTLTDEIYTKSLRIKGLVSKKFKILDSRVSFTFDAGTSRAFDPYLMLTAHWIDADWHLHEQILAFREIVGDHSGSNTGALLVELLGEYGLVDPDKLGWGTADGSTVCDKAIRVLAKSVDPTGERWVAKERRTRCMEHAIHCASRAFVTKVGPTPMASIKSTLSSRRADADEDDEELTATVDLTDDPADPTEFDPGDLLGKILAFVNQVRSSPQARKYFHKLCKDENLRPLQLLKWIRTRWASLYDLINRLLDVRPACNKFTVLADDDDRVPNLKPPKTYAMFKLTEGEWRLLELIREGLKGPALSCQTFSHSNRPTAFRAFPIIESMQQRWELMARDPRYAQIVPGLEAGLHNLRKWYRALDDSSVYFICLVLDPRVKMAYFQKHWEEIYLDNGTQTLNDTVSLQFHRVLTHLTDTFQFDQYYTASPSATAATSDLTLATLHVEEQPADMLYGSAWIQSAVASRVAEEAEGTDPRQELQTYLTAALEHHRVLADTAVIKWWKDHSVVYPTLARMARDFLAVPGSSTASERQFSSARHIGTDFRNRISPTMFEAVQVLKGGYKAGVLSAHIEAKALAEELDCAIDDLILEDNGGDN
jgi:hypothetical protein